ncbi:MAG: methylated-DNA--[protein]-cysteine S-methyltransferase [Chloroflexota bacterium]|nr:methylated-DNA--[protein]-cysteine S-methyltransferase [Chloroflexota bacterium]
MMGLLNTGGVADMVSRELNESQAKLVAQVCDYLRDIRPEAAGLQELGARFHISPFHLQRIFKRATGISPRQYAADLRLEAFKAQVRGGARITDAIYDAGYGSASRLYEQSDERLGMTPSTYRKLGAGMTIFYSAVPCNLGFLLTAVTERGICKLSLGEAPEPLIADLEAEFARAERIHDDEGVGYWVERIIAYLEGWQPDLDLPLDVRATAFQLKVWERLQAIPVGETRSYSEIAAAIGQPSAVRAVANACASNPVALVIPCHRVIRLDKSLGGYRWGIERKRALLERERRYLERAGQAAASAR